MKHFSVIYFLIIFALILVASAHAAPNKDRVLDIQNLTTDNGIEVWLVEDHSVPIVSVSFSMPGGLSADPLDKAGLSNLLSAMMDEGAGEYDAQAFQQILSENSIALHFNAGRDYFSGSFQTLTRTLDTAIELTNLSLTQLRFDDDALTRMKQAIESEIKHNIKRPGWIAARSFNGLMFEGDAYGLPGKGTLSSLAAMTQEDLHNQSQLQFNTEGMKIAIAGDVTAQQAKLIASELTKGMPNKRNFKLPKKKAKFRNTGKTFLYEYDAPQTHIVIGHEGIPVSDEDWPAVQIINYVFGGGGFDSRLMEEIREKRGLTYGVGSYLSNLKRTATIQASLSTSNKNTAEALDILKKEWVRMATTGPTDKEIQNAKDYLTGSLLLNLTSTDSIANNLNGLQKYGFDHDYINRRNQRIMDVTADQARVVAGRLLNSDELMVIMVGPHLNDGAQTGADITQLDKIPGMGQTQ